jgi:hypothetical protein
MLSVEEQALPPNARLNLVCLDPSAFGFAQPYLGEGAATFHDDPR